MANGTTDRRTLNVGRFVTDQLGGTFAGIVEDDPTKIRIRVLDQEGEETERVFNLAAALEQEGINLEKTDLKFNDPETALEDTAGGFTLGVQLELAKSPKDKLKVLRDEFGDANVVRTPEGIKVKDSDGVWKTAGASILQTLASESPVIAGGIGGFAAGIKLGALAAPITGGLSIPIGGILGGAVGATLGRLGQIKGAEALDIRTEADAEEVQKELGREFANALIWDTVLLGTGKIVRPVARGIKGAAKRTFDKFFDKDTIAQTMKTFFPGTNTADWATILRTTDDANAVLKDMDDVVKFNQRAAKGAVRPGQLNPADEKATRITSSFLKSAKTRASSQFEEGMNLLEKQAAFTRGRVDSGAIRDNLKTSLQAVGVVDNAGNILGPKQLRELGPDVEQIFSASSRNKLAQAFRLFDNAAAKRASGEVTVKEARNLLRSLDDVLESSGVFKNGDLAITDRARGILKQTRNDIRNSMSESLQNIIVRDRSGNNVKAAALFNDTMRKYSDFRNVFDDFALTGKSRLRTLDTVRKMFGPKGADLEAGFGRLAENVGVDEGRMLGRLKQLRAASNLGTDVYTPSRTGPTALTFQTIFGGPREGAKFAARTGERLARPQSVVSRASLNALQKAAKGVEFLKNMPINQRLQLFSNPDLFRQFTGSILDNIRGEDELAQGLVQQGIQSAGDQ